MLLCTSEFSITAAAAAAADVAAAAVDRASVHRRVARDAPFILSFPLHAPLNLLSEFALQPVAQGRLPGIRSSCSEYADTSLDRIYEGETNEGGSNRNYRCWAGDRGVGPVIGIWIRLRPADGGCDVWFARRFRSTDSARNILFGNDPYRWMLMLTARRIGSCCN